MSMKVKSSLEPVLVTGAKKGIQAALPIVESWGSKSRRTRHHRDKTHNGLYWATYQATVRREGVFTSGSAGPAGAAGTAGTAGTPWAPAVGWGAEPPAVPRTDLDGAPDSRPAPQELGEP